MYVNKTDFQLQAQYITNNGLGGAMVWAIDTDDFHNIGGKGNYPLLSTIKMCLH
jgi:chitinase